MICLCCVHSLFSDAAKGQKKKKAAADQRQFLRVDSELIIILAHSALIQQYVLCVQKKDWRKGKLLSMHDCIRLKLN